VGVAIVQTDPKLGDVTGSLRRAVEHIEEAAACGSALVVFAECALTGYMLRSEQEARAAAEPVPGPSTGRLAVLAVAAGDREDVIVAELDTELAREKTKEPGQDEYAVRLWADRRPELYGPLLEGSPAEAR
jgi:carbon-nitrogen hydrolase